MSTHRCRYRRQGLPTRGAATAAVGDEGGNEPLRSGQSYGWACQHGVPHHFRGSDAERAQRPLRRIHLAGRDLQEGVAVGAGMERLNRPCHGTVHLPCELREVVADHGPVGDDHGERGIARFRIDVPLQIPRPGSSVARCARSRWPRTSCRRGRTRRRRRSAPRRRVRPRFGQG